MHVCSIHIMKKIKSKMPIETMTWVAVVSNLVYCIPSN